MSEYSGDIQTEIDCEVSVYEGSWATCDMAAKEEEA
jgi:hypothetical protein